MMSPVWLRLLVAVAVGAGAVAAGFALGDPHPLATAVPFGLGWLGGGMWRTR